MKGKGEKGVEVMYYAGERRNEVNPVSINERNKKDEEGVKNHMLNGKVGEKAGKGVEIMCCEGKQEKE